MKNKIKTTLIVSAVLILLGIVIAVVGLAMNGFDFKKFATQKRVEKTYAVSAQFGVVSVQAENTGVRFALSTDGTTKIVSNMHEKVSYAISTENGVLRITEQDNRKWHEKFGIGFGVVDTVVYLPAGEYQTLTFTGKTCDVTLSAGLTFGEVSITVTTGDIKFASAANTLSMEITTGDISVSRTAADAITATVTTGDVEMENVTANTLTVTASTGDVDLDDVITVGKTEISTDTGDVELMRCDAGSYEITTRTGEVEMRILSPKQYTVTTKMGDKHIPKIVVGANGECKVTTRTGDIYIRVLGPNER